jgi:hypothetical protein
LCKVWNCPAPRQALLQAVRSSGRRTGSTIRAGSIRRIRASPLRPCLHAMRIGSHARQAVLQKLRTCHRCAARRVRSCAGGNFPACKGRTGSNSGEPDSSSGAGSCTSPARRTGIRLANLLGTRGTEIPFSSSTGRNIQLQHFALSAAPIFNAADRNRDWGRYCFARGSRRLGSVRSFPSKRLLGSNSAFHTATSIHTG